MKTNASRREFLRSGAAAAGAAAVLAAPLVIADDRVKGANDRIGVGFIGAGGRARAHLDIVNDLQEKGPRPAGGRVRRLSAPLGGRQPDDRRGEDVHGARGPPGRPERRRGLHRHARPPARPAGHRRPQRRQGRLLRKAADPLEPVRAGQEGPGGGRQEQAAGAGRHAAHGRRQLSGDHQADPRRDHRQAGARHVQLLPPRRLGRADADSRRQRQARPGPALGALPGRRPEGRFQRLAVLPVADVLGLRRRPGHRPPGPHLHAHLLHPASSAIPSGSSAAAARSSSTAKCPTSATSSPTIPAGRAW